MTKTNIKEELFSDCPIRNILARISDKWSMLILFMLYQNGTMRFNSLRHNIPDISQKSERGKSIIPHIEGLIDWAKNNLEDILNDRKKNSAK